MASRLGLRLNPLSRARKAAPEAAALPERPAGRLVWLHARDHVHLPAAAELARRIRDDDGHPVLLTFPEELAAEALRQGGILTATVPADQPGEARAFVDHWRPECAVIVGGELRAALLGELDRRRIPHAMINARAPALARGRDSWWPGTMRSVLARMRHVHVIDETAARAFLKAGANPAAVHVSGRLEEGSAALPCTEAERAALAHRWAARPVWLAADLPQDEETAVIEAHRHALRLAHRLLLIVLPRDPARVPALAERMETQERWAVARRSQEEEPDPETEVYIVENPSEYGLWYRLAPITFLGGSLSGTGCYRNPMEAAALGSAIIHGPRPGPWGVAFGRLGAARGARSVASASDLAEALADLLSPDRMARLAGAAWGVCSDGVEATERALSLVRHLLGEE